jgi:hypothetical protein
MPQVIFILATFWIGLNCSAAFAQHPAEHQAIHEKFYSTWMMPDAPYVSCCHNEDCSPAESKVETGIGTPARAMTMNGFKFPQARSSTAKLTVTGFKEVTSFGFGATWGGQCFPEFMQRADSLEAVSSTAFRRPALGPKPNKSLVE